MGLTLNADATCTFTSGTNWTPPVSGIVAVRALVDVTPRAGTSFRTIVSDGDGSGVGHHFLLRINDLSTVNNPGGFQFTTYDGANNPHHYYSGVPLSTGLQVIGVVLNVADYTTAKLIYNGTINTITGVNGAGTSGWNANSNPIRIFRRGDAIGGFDEKCYGVQIWNADPGDVAWNKMIGVTQAGVFQHPHRFSAVNMLHDFRCNSTGTFTDRISEQVFTQSGTAPTTNATPNGVEDGGVELQQPDGTAGKDTSIKEGNPTFNYGTSLTLTVGASATNVRQRGLIEFTLAEPSSSYIETYATLNLTWTTGAANAKDLVIARITRTWVEGTGAGSATGDGANVATYDGVNNWTVSLGDFTLTDASTTANGIPTSTGSQDYVITALAADAVLSRSNVLSLMLKASAGDEAESVAGVGTFAASDNATAANRPKLKVWYVVPATGTYTPPSTGSPGVIGAGISSKFIGNARRKRAA